MDEPDIGAGPILADETLRAQILQLAPELPDRVLPAIRLVVARDPARGDLSTNAALLAAAATGRDAHALAGMLAQTLQASPGIGSAAASNGHVNLRYRDDGLADLLAAILAALPAAAARRAMTGPATLATGARWRLPVAALTLSDPMVAIQYMHTRCRSVLRAADAIGPMFEALQPAEARPMTPEARRLLCRVEHWRRIAATVPEPRSILLYLRDLTEDFDRMWKRGGDDATLAVLYPEDPGRSRAGLALISATADVIHRSLALLGIVAAEELQ